VCFEVGNLRTSRHNVSPTSGKRRLTILSVARSTFAAYGSAPGTTRCATVPRTEVNAFHHLVATFEQLLNPFRQVFIFAFLVLRSCGFRQRTSVDSGGGTDLVESRALRCLSNDPIDFCLILCQTSLTCRRSGQPLEETFRGLGGYHCGLESMSR
jgi:hypothetical protein